MKSIAIAQRIMKKEIRLCVLVHPQRIVSTEWVPRTLGNIDQLTKQAQAAKDAGAIKVWLSSRKAKA